MNCFELWYKEYLERAYRGELQEDEDWINTLLEVTSMEGTYSIAIKEGDEYVGTAMVTDGLSLHGNNLQTVFGMVAKEGYGTKLVREIIKETKRRGYTHLHVSKHIKGNLYEARYLQLK